MSTKPYSEENYEPFVANSGLSWIEHAFYTAVPKAQYKVLMCIVKELESLELSSGDANEFRGNLIERLHEYKALL